MRILYQFPLSHYCEKARWILDYKQLNYVAHNLIPGVHRAFAQLKTGQGTLPILKDQGNWIADSTLIALYLDEHYPEHPLLKSNQYLRDQALETNLLATTLGEHVRRWGLAHSLSKSDESLEIMIGEKGYLRQFEKFSKPILKSLVTKNYQLNDENVQASKLQIDNIVAQLNQQLLENGGKYLIGARLGLADIAVCSMLAPLLELESTPWEKEFGAESSEQFELYKAELLSLPLGQYVKRTYANERNARVDWRGV
ncbi:glutathione S-transferase family protein [Acinetobacter rudis]|uniref:Glutathione S-transferase n=1 Tax=Acinetobacter rudis TaxID=632955 RepID=A0AAW8J6T4_9GAMM|nr:glutathione S-transferase [Acinetobacter rudis]MDQ8935434.1 glutathione S-transferase [Acinetobacter rudis]MDQ8952255.1 glutathione S-transferase [Acinetobacter rudis]MDQ9017697.1 glutathione S-transferase [Acinetobacter rudis]